VKRQCTVIKSSREYGVNYNRHICIDVEVADEIKSIIFAKKKKFWKIVDRILTQPFMYYDHYAKEKINSSTSNVTAIKFFDPDNTRIYCQEFSGVNGMFYIICGASVNKRVQKNDKRIDSLIEKVSEYEYEVL
jgi:hypothetical protein